jgi:hypothetical protein
MNADDCLPRDPLGRVEGGDSIVEGRDVADVGPQSSVAHPPDDLTQLRTIGLDDEVDGQTVRGPRLGRPYNGHQGSSRADQACGPLLDVSADDVEHQVDAADVFQGVAPGVGLAVELTEAFGRLRAVTVALGGEPADEQPGDTAFLLLINGWWEPPRIPPPAERTTQLVVRRPRHGTADPAPIAATDEVRRAWRSLVLLHGPG